MTLEAVLADIPGREVVKLAEAFGWVDVGGSKHPFLLKRAGMRPVPARNKLKNIYELQDILKQLAIPRDTWPENFR